MISYDRKKICVEIMCRCAELKCSQMYIKRVTRKKNMKEADYTLNVTRGISVTYYFELNIMLYPVGVRLSLFYKCSKLTSNRSC